MASKKNINADKTLPSLAPLDHLDTAIDPYLRLHLLLQEFYLQRRRIRMRYSVGKLSISQAQMLCQILAEPTTTAGSLSAVLQLEKSTISRTLGALIKKGYVIAAKTDGDRRQKTLRLTERGLAQVTELSVSQRQILRECLIDLSVSEQNDLRHYLRLLADGLGCTAATPLPGDHPITSEIVRLGRGLGMTGHQFMGSDFSPILYHVLRVIVHTDLLPEPSRLGSVLPFESTSLIRTIRTLKSKRLIAKLTKAQSSGGPRIVATDAGREQLRACEAKAALVLATALANIRTEQLDHFLSLLDRICGVKLSKVKEIVIQDRIDVRPLQCLEDRRHARGILIEQLYRNNQHFETDDYLYSPEGKHYGLYINNVLKAVASLPLDQSGNLPTQLATSIDLDERIRAEFVKVLEQIARNSTSGDMD